MTQIKDYLVSFVLLYYKDYDNTIKCIESILSLDNTRYKTTIVLVDNCSQDNAFERFKELYKNQDNIFYITNKKNLGFARGNNVGISYAVKTLKSDFVIAINTDTIINQIDFCNKIVEIYEKKHFDVLGPRVKGYVSDNDQSPIYADYDQDTRKKIIKDGIKWFFWKIHIGGLIEKKQNLNVVKPNNKKINRYRCVCSGCCLVFSPHFFERWKGFYPGTFLYREESILFYIINRVGGKTYFAEEIVIKHKGGESTSKEFGKNDRKRNLRIYSNRLESLKKELQLKKLNVEDLSKEI